MKATRIDDFTAYVCEQLDGLGSIRPKKMFGGVGIYCDEVFFAIVAYDTLWFKVDDGNRADYKALGCRPFKPFPDRDTVMSYHEVPADIIDDRRRILEWGHKAVEAGQRSAKPKRRASR